MPFPTVAAPIVAWFDGTLSEYTDAGGTVVAAPGDLVRRINEASPLTSDWRASSDDQRPARIANGFRMDPFGPAYPGRLLTRTAIPALTSVNNATLVISFVPKDGFGGPQMALCASGSPQFGVFGGAGQLSVFVPGYGTWTPFQDGPAIARANSRGSQMSLLVRFGSGQVRASLLVNGTTYTNTLTASVTSGALAQTLYVGYPFAGNQAAYIALGQIVLLDGQTSDPETAAILAWCASNALPAGFPLDQPLLEFVGDSIPRGGVGVQIEKTDGAIVLKAIRAGVAPGAELCNVAVVGAGAASTCYTDQLQAIHSASRVKELALVSVGTNDLANGASAASVLAAIYSLCDLMRAAGIKVILRDILPRQGLFNSPGNQSVFDANVAIVNADLAANALAHADAFVRASIIAGLNDPANATYYQGDKTHPNDAGYALLAAAELPAFSALLSAPAAVQRKLTIERQLDITVDPPLYLFS